MPDFRVAYQTFTGLATNLWLLTGLSQTLEDEGGNGARLRRLRLVQRRPRAVVAVAPEDEDEPAAVLRLMGML